MVSLAHKLIRLLLVMPRRRYNIFSGSNKFSEWYQMAWAWMRGGPYDEADVIADYEHQFAQACGVKHGISFGAGRMALYAILEVLNIGEGDEVIIPAFTCVVVPNAIIYRGAKPIYVDIEPRFFNIDVSKVEAAITSKTKAIYAQHTFGVPCNVEALRTLGQRYRLPVIEDAAHALGAYYQDKPVGSLTEVAFFSTDHSKVINTQLGGMVVTNDDVLASRLRRLQEGAGYLDKKVMHALVRSFLLEYILSLPSVLWIGRIIHVVLARLGFLFYFQDELETTMPISYPYPCRLSSAQAQLGLSQLEDLQKNLAHRRQIANWLERRTRWNQMDSDEVNRSTWLRYSFLVKDRHKFEVAFSKYFDLGIWFTSVVSGREENLRAVWYEPGSCPVAEYVVKHIVNFPTHQRIPIKVIQKEVNRHWNWLGYDIDNSFANTGRDSYMGRSFLDGINQ